MPDDVIAIARTSYQAYVAKDRSAIEALIGENFHFTSPLDNRIDRTTYFNRCWPNSETVADFRFINLVKDGERVFVTYEGTAGGPGATGRCFRSTEILTIQNGKIVEVKVYFGWTLPHPVPAGGSA
jgi:ketosteroid isomerase-like protein